MELSDLVGSLVKIKNYQATFVNLEFQNTSFRFDFIDKREFRLKIGTSAILNYLDHHPLLLDYNEPMVTTYINSKPSNVDNFIAEVHSAIDQVTSGWRNWIHYITDSSINFTLGNFMRNVKEGNGRLLVAPLSVTNLVIQICERYHVDSKSFESKVVPKPKKLLLINTNYVIAENFRSHNSV